MKKSSKIKKLAGYLFKSKVIPSNKNKVELLRFFSLIGFFIIVLLIFNSSLNQFEKNSRNEAINIVKTSLNASHITVKQFWAKNQFGNAEIWASDPGIIQSTKELLKLTEDSILISQSAEMTIYREFFTKRLQIHNALDIFIISPDFINIASMNNENIGKLNLISKSDKTLLEKVFKGQNQLVPPLVSDIPLLDENGKLVTGNPNMFIMVPIKDINEGIIAALCLQFDPLRDFSRLPTINEIGDTGDTYIVDNKGNLITESRFLRQLYSIGLISSENHSLLNIEIRDPGVNLLEGLEPKQSNIELPFTYAVEQLLKGKSGFSTSGYRDYRGVKVLGAWIWDDDLGIGFISEIDEDEAFALYKTTRLLSISLLTITLLLMLIIEYFNRRKQLKNISIIEEKERYFRSLLDQSVSGIIIIDTTGTIEIFNKAAQNIFGYNSELIGENINRLLSKHTLNQHFNYINNPLKKGKTKFTDQGIEVIGVKKDNTEFPMFSTISEISIEDRVIFMVMITDLSQQKEIEKSLFKIEELLKCSFNQAPIAMVVSDLDFNINKMNETFCVLLGYSEEDLLNLNFKDLVYPDDLQKSYENVAYTNDDPINEIIENRYVKNNGDLIWGKTKASILKNKSGQKVGRIFVIEDITSRKKTQKVLQEHSNELENSNIELSNAKKSALDHMQVAVIEKLRAEKALKNFSEEKELSEQTINSVPGIFFICDRYGKPYRWNKQYQKLTELTHKEIMKSHPLDLIIKEDKEDIINLFKNLKQQISLELRINTEQKITPFLFKIEPIEIVGKEYLIGTGINISKLKKLEDKLKNAIIKAELASKAKSTFIATMSHEIRTPMNAILGFTEILSKRVTDQTLMEYISSIQSSGKTLLSIINDILDLRKIESEKIYFRIEPTDINILISEVIEMFNLKADEKGLSLITNISVELPDILHIDEQRFKQIVINLINNAIKFTNEGYVEIEISQKNKSKNKLDLVLKVSDTGIGIPKESHKKIFKAFEQEDDLDNRKYEGTGLGLSIIKQLVAKMNGKITLNSTPNKGSVFKIIFKNIKFDNNKLKYVENIKIDTELIQFEESTVLIVDDIKINRDLLISYMSEFKINVIEANNGQKALDCIKNYNPDLVYIGLKLPVLNGYETLEIIKKNEHWSHIPIIAVATSAYDRDEDKVMAFGFDGYILKPASYNDIIGSLKKHLKHIVTNTEDNINVIHTIDKLHEVLADLNNEAMPLWEEIKKIRKKTKVLLFADLISKIGKKYNAEPLIDYSKQLHLACKTFNIVKEKKLIQQFPDFIKTLN